MKKILIYIFLFFWFSQDFTGKLSSQQTKKKKFVRILIEDFESKEPNQNISERLQNLLMTELISRGEKKFLFMDSSTIEALLDQKTLDMQMGVKGASEELKQIAREGVFQERVTAKVTTQGNQLVLNLRQATFQPRYSLKTSISLRFYSYQLEYYAKEIAKKILNSRYQINRRRAPSLADVEIKIQDLVLSDIKLGKFQLQKIQTSSKPIFSLDSNQDYGNLSVFVSAMRKYVDQADQSYNQTDYSQATETYEKILTAIRTLAKTKQKKLRVDVRKIETRILNSQLLFYQTEIKKTDPVLQAKNYSEAFETYQKIAFSIEKDKNFKNQSMQKVYALAQRRFRLSNQQEKLFQVQAIDKEVKAETELSTEQLEDFYQRYRSLYEENQSLPTYARTKKTNSVLRNRVVSLSTQLAKSIERKGDFYREELNFPTAETEYKLALAGFETRTLKTQRENQFQKRLQAKIKNNRTSGKLFLQNQIVP